MLVVVEHVEAEQAGDSTTASPAARSSTARATASSIDVARTLERHARRAIARGDLVGRLADQHHRAARVARSASTSGA